MKAMIVSDFAVLRSALLQLLGICLVIALFMGYVMGAVGTAAAIAAMVPFMGLFSLAAYDEQNNWERFRLTLPLTRRQVVFGPGGAPAGGMVAREPLAGRKHS